MTRSELAILTRYLEAVRDGKPLGEPFHAVYRLVQAANERRRIRRCKDGDDEHPF